MKKYDGVLFMYYGERSSTPRDIHCEAMSFWLLACENQGFLNCRYCKSGFSQKPAQLCLQGVQFL